MMKVLLLLCSSAFLIAIAYIYAPDLLINRISAEDATRTNLDIVMWRIQKFAAMNHQLPKSLADLPITTNQNAELRDGYGHPLIYIPQPDGSVILRSTGNNGKNGCFIQFSIFDKTNADDSIARLMTVGAMSNLERLIRDYVVKYRGLPSTLSDLSNISDDVDSNLIDGWGNPISYNSGPDGSVILSSHGKSGSGQIWSDGFTLSGIMNVPPTATTQK